ncbi:MAG: sigma-E processing peptidase SpoIIGA [Anaerovoracaceae bacterium]|jgi:stage II sporulation protein GA (sporulation sigma-E factor processing peptidase)
MVVYAEYLFFENFLSGLFLLHATALLRGITPNKMRLLGGAALCGFYSFTLFLDLHNILLLLVLKAGFSFILLTVVFFLDMNLFRSMKNMYFWRSMGKLALVFYLCSFVMGGVVIGLLYLLSIPCLTYSGGFYIGNISYWHVYVGMILSWCGLLVLSSFLKGVIQKNRRVLDVEISILDKSIVLRGMVDTGNFLLDPISGKPVFLVKEDALSAFPRDDWKRRYRYIPYESIGNSEGLLKGLRPDRIILIKETVRHPTDAILALYNGNFSTGSHEDECQLLLHPSALGDDL